MFFDAEHFFDGYRRDPEYALATLRGRGARPAPSCSSSATRNGGTLPSEIGAAIARRCRAVARAARHPLPQRLRARGRELARRGRRGRDAGAGHDQRLRRALRQREPVLVIAEPRAQARLRLRAARQHSARLTRAVALRLRAREHGRPTSASRSSARARSRTRAACTSPRCAKNAEHLRAHRPERVGNAQRVLVSELSGRSNVALQGASSSASTSTRRTPSVADVLDAGEGARERGLPVRRRRGVVRAADAGGAAGQYRASSSWSASA